MNEHVVTWLANGEKEEEGFKGVNERETSQIKKGWFGWLTKAEFLSREALRVYRLGGGTSDENWVKQASEIHIMQWRKRVEEEEEKGDFAEVWHGSSSSLEAHELHVIQQDGESGGEKAIITMLG